MGRLRRRPATAAPLRRARHRSARHPRRAGLGRVRAALDARARRTPGAWARLPAGPTSSLRAGSRGVRRDRRRRGKRAPGRPRGRAGDRLGQGGGGGRGGEVAAIPTTLSGAPMTAIHRLPEGRGAATGVRPSLVIAYTDEMTSAPEPQLRATAMNALAHGADSLYTPLADETSRGAGLRGAELIARASTSPPAGGTAPRSRWAPCSAGSPSTGLDRPPSRPRPDRRQGARHAPRGDLRGALAPHDGGDAIAGPGADRRSPPRSGRTARGCESGSPIWPVTAISASSEPTGRALRGPRRRDGRGELEHITRRGDAGGPRGDPRGGLVAAVESALPVTARSDGVSVWAWTRRGCSATTASRASAASTGRSIPRATDPCPVLPPLLQALAHRPRARQGQGTSDRRGEPPQLPRPLRDRRPAAVPPAPPLRGEDGALR